jgi:hypothetical protein
MVIVDGVRTEPTASPPARPSQTTSIKYAAIVPLIAVGTLAFFMFVNVLGSGSTAPPPSPALSSFGSTEPLARTFNGLEPDLAPPADILNSVVLPRSVRDEGLVPAVQNPSSFDAEVLYQSSETQGWLVAFAKAQLVHEGWQVISTGSNSSTPGAFQVLARRVGSDGFYWDVGFIIHSTTFTSNGAGVPVQSTSFDVRLLQDDST